ncbi:unnamed protein product, partial [Owenia fusiformis]
CQMFKMLPDYLTLPLCGFVFFPSLFIFVRKIAHTFLGSYFNESDQVNISVKVVSSTHAVLAVIAGVIVMSNTHGDIIKDQHWLLNPFFMFATPYMAYDVVAMYIHHTVRFRTELQGQTMIQCIVHYFSKNKVMMFHHICLPMVYLPAVLHFRGPKGDFIVGLFLMFEVTVPFLNLRNILYQANLAHTMLYKVNGILMTVSFFLSRIVIFIYMYYMYGVYAGGVGIWKVPGIIPMKCTVGCTVLLLPQIYWFKQMIKGVYATVVKKKVV